MEIQQIKKKQKSRLEKYLITSFLCFILKMAELTKQQKYFKEYYSRPEVKARVKAYNRLPEVKARRKAQKQTPKQRAKWKDYMKNRRQSPEWKARHKFLKKRRAVLHNK